MTDLRSLADDEVIALIEVSRGFDREVLVGVLGKSSGVEGVPYLRSLRSKRGRGSGHLRVAAIGSLAMRLGEEAAAELVPFLEGGTLETQLAAVSWLENVDDGRSACNLFGWLGGRLRHAGRANTYGYYELSGVLRYARRVHKLMSLLEVLDRDYERLDPDERGRLDRVWPVEARRRYRETGEEDDGPDPRALEEWFLLSTADFPCPEATEPVEADEFEETAIRRARRRLLRADV